MKRCIAITAIVPFMILVGAAQAADYFIASDDYRDGEEIVNVFLKGDEYRIMVEDIERNGEAFDWGWVKTTDEFPAVTLASKPKLLGRLKIGRGSKPAEPKNHGFSLASYKTVSVPKIENFSGIVPPALTVSVHDSFVLAMKEAGLEVVPEGEKADLELKVVIVDVSVIRPISLRRRTLRSIILTRC